MTVVIKFPWIKLSDGKDGIGHGWPSAWSSELVGSTFSFKQFWDQAFELQGLQERQRDDMALMMAALSFPYEPHSEPAFTEHPEAADGSHFSFVTIL